MDSHRSYIDSTSPKPSLDWNILDLDWTGSGKLELDFSFTKIPVGVDAGEDDTADEGPELLIVQTSAELVLDEAEVVIIS